MTAPQANFEHLPLLAVCIAERPEAAPPVAPQLTRTPRVPAPRRPMRKSTAIDDELWPLPDGWRPLQKRILGVQLPPKIPALAPAYARNPASRWANVAWPPHLLNFPRLPCHRHPTCSLGGGPRRFDGRLQKRPKLPKNGSSTIIPEQQRRQRSGKTGNCRHGSTSTLEATAVWEATRPRPRR